MIQNAIDRCDRSRLVVARAASILLVSTSSAAWSKDWIQFSPPKESDNGRHIVLLSGDEEYRSEEGLPMLAKILSRRHGFHCSVHFSVNDQGVIDPENQASLTGAEALDSADAIIMLLRFRNWPDDVMERFVRAYERGVPIVALRTSTHAFQYPPDRETKYRGFNQFGKRVLGEGWVSHWGRHKQEATRGVIEPAAAKNPVLKGVSDVFGDSDVYEAYPPSDATILLRGQVLQGMSPQDPPAKYSKKRRSDKAEQDVNAPMMPVAWTRVLKNEAGNENRIFCTTLGAATDLQSEGLRRMIVNAVYWGLGQDVPDKADVQYVGKFEPTKYGFGDFLRGIKPTEHEFGRFEVVASEGKATVKLEGELFTEYLVQSGAKPALWPLIGPTGSAMTRGFPLRKATKGEKDDHIHHRSFWFTHGEVNDSDFWSEGHKNGGRIVHREFTQMTGGRTATIGTVNDWIDRHGVAICRDERTLVFGTDDDDRYVDFDIVITATGDQPVHFGDTKEGSFGLRVAGSMKQESGGTIVNQQGHKNREAWGKQSPWVDYFGSVDGETAGIAILNHPQSFRFPTYWHVRTYGLFAANVFGLHHFKDDESLDGSHVLEPGDSMSFFYRVILHRGDHESAKIDEAFKRYAAMSK